MLYRVCSKGVDSYDIRDNFNRIRFSLFIDAACSLNTGVRLSCCCREKKNSRLNFMFNGLTVNILSSNSIKTSTKALFKLFNTKINLQNINDTTRVTRRASRITLELEIGLHGSRVSFVGDVKYESNLTKIDICYHLRLIIFRQRWVLVILRKIILNRSRSAAVLVKYETMWKLRLLSCGFAE